MSDDLFNTIYNKSLDLLSRREHSFKEIKDKLDMLKPMYRLEKEKDLDLKRLLLNCHQKVLMNQ